MVVVVERTKGGAAATVSELWLDVLLATVFMPTKIALKA
jgi:hypothetical protein